MRRPRAKIWPCADLENSVPFLPVRSMPLPVGAKPCPFADDAGGTMSSSRLTSCTRAASSPPPVQRATRSMPAHEGLPAGHPERSASGSGTRQRMADLRKAWRLQSERQIAEWLGSPRLPKLRAGAVRSRYRQPAGSALALPPSLGRLPSLHGPGTSARLHGLG